MREVFGPIFGGPVNFPMDDRSALGSDWKAVGDDIRKAMSKFDR